MKELNDLGKTVASVDPDKIKLDGNVKKILSYKPLLARLFKETVSECSNLSFEEIERCMEGEAIIDGIFVENGLSNTGGLIQGQANEDYQNSEGLIRYDIRTYLNLPGKKQLQQIEEITQRKELYTKVLINVESQNEEKPGYDIPLRALFYCCRMISSQLGVEFTTDSDDPVKYGNMKKVYSIFICTETAQKRANSIEKYEIRKKFLYGKNNDTPRYDILNAIIINISKKHNAEGVDNELIKLLTTLFDESLAAREKINKLEKEHDLPITKEIEKEVNHMCTYADCIENKGIQKGLRQGISQGIEQGIRFSLLDILEGLGEIPKELRERIDSEKDAETLRKWVKFAAGAENVDGFVRLAESARIP